MNRSTILVAALFWVSMAALIIGIITFDGWSTLPWFLAAAVLLAAAYALRAYATRRNPPT